MLKGFKVILTFISDFPQYYPSDLAVTSQAENEKPLRRGFKVILTEYLFKYNDFRKSKFIYVRNVKVLLMTKDLGTLPDL